MADILLVDTDILIDGARAMPDAIEFLKVRERSHTLALSVITEMELLVGCRNKTEQSRLDRSLECFKIIYLQETMSLQAARLLRTYSLDKVLNKVSCSD